MPFDPAPQQPEVKVGKYQRFADGLLRGCEQSGPLRGAMSDREGNNRCAMGAILLGMLPSSVYGKTPIETAGEYWQLMWDYKAKYGSEIHRDNDTGRFTREEIAARIAAL